MGNQNPVEYEFNGSLAEPGLTDKLIHETIELSRNSKNEKETDPKVGAIIWFPRQRKIVAAYREDMTVNKFGSHAEEIAINYAKFRELPLEEATIFTTL
ncbi:MAG: hypothetical protein HQM08_28990 [Candidatus Riflebacteria bacterium]|nr:hypothetical protein [Candidatus Riflebacteria bacterium]